MVVVVVMMVWRKMKEQLYPEVVPWRDQLASQPQLLLDPSCDAVSSWIEVDPVAAAVGVAIERDVGHVDAVVALVVVAA